MEINENNVFHFKFSYVIIDDTFFLSCKDLILCFIEYTQPQSIVWGRTEGNALPANIFQDGSRGYQDYGAAAGGYDQGYQYGGEQQPGGIVEVIVELNDATLSRGEKGTEQYTVTWGKYAHETSLPDYARVRIE